MKLNSDIQAVLDRAKNDFSAIKIEYDKSLNEKEISSDLRISIKNCLENIRSSLDYLAYQIFEENCKGDDSKVYFPIYSESKEKFEKFTKKTFPDLENTNKKIYDSLESSQYYNNSINNEWMKDLMVLVNGNKHRKLSPQTRIEQKQLSLSSGGAGIRLGGGASIRLGGGASIRIGGKTIYGGQTISADSPSVRADPGLDVQRTIWIDFKFDELGKSVIPTISKILDGSQAIVENFKKLIYS